VRGLGRKQGGKKKKKSVYSPADLEVVLPEIRDSIAKKATARK